MIESTAAEELSGFSRWFKDKSRPGWLWLVVLVTLLYLLLEFSFSARLLDVVGGTPTDAQVRAIEHWGRLLSGFALALMLWPSLLSLAEGDPWKPRTRRIAAVLWPSLLSLEGRRWTVRARIAGVLGLTAVSMVAVFQAEGWLDRCLVDHSSAEQRQVAMNVGLLQRGLADHLVVLDQFKADPAIFDTPEGKAFLGLFPLLAFSQDDINRRLLPQREAIMRAVIEKRSGHLGDYYNRFLASLKALRRDYNDHYVAGYNRYVDAINGIGARQDEAWHKYVDRLARHDWVGQRIMVPRAYWLRVRSQVRRAGVPVTASWQPDDRDGFDRALEHKIRSAAEARFRSAMRAAFPDAGDIPPGTSFEAMLSRPDVQKTWAARLGYPESTPAHPYHLPTHLPADTTRALEQYRHRVHEPVMALLVEKTLQPYKVQLAELADGHSQADQGRSAYRRMIVPPLALGFSLLGALVHVFKSLLYLIQVATGVAFRHGWAKFACVLALSLSLFVLAPVVVPGTVTAQPLYQTLLGKVQRLGGQGQPTLGGRLLAIGIDGAVHTEKIGYGVFEYVRMVLLGGVDFSHDPLPEAD